jgi:Ca2+-binding EF-hand superfamily protein
MGANTSMDLNITMMSSIIQCNLTDVQNVLLHMEGRPKIKTALEQYFQARQQSRSQQDEEMNRERKAILRDINGLPAAGESCKGGIPSSSPATPPRATSSSGAIGDEKGSPFAIGKEELVTFEREVKQIIIDPSLYLMKPEELEEVLGECRFNASDTEVILNLYTLIDRRGFESIDIRVVLIAFVMLLAGSPRQFLDIAFQLFDRVGSGLIEKKDLLDICLLANDTLLFFGDKNLKSMQIVDFVDSVFTSAGKIDGEIFYPDYLDTMTDHPIMEMLLSPQFQGNIRSKLINEASLAQLDMSV